MKKLLVALSILLASIPAFAAPINVYQIVGPGGLIDPGLLVQYLAQPIALNNPTVSGQILANDGNAAAPTYSFSSLSTLGFYKSGSARIGWTNGGYGGQLTSGGVIIKSTGSLIWGNDDTEAPTLDLSLFRDAADILAQRRTTNAQTFRVYNTFTDASNYERLGVTWSSNVVTIAPQSAGTGTLRSLVVQTSAPNTQTGGTYTVSGADNYIIANIAGTQTLTLPAPAAANTGRAITVKTITANTVVSASSNVVPLAGGAASTPILAATAGKWATLVSDGTNWVIMSGN